MHLRKEYYNYCLDCIDAGEVPWDFRSWFWVSYHYEILDNQ